MTTSGGYARPELLAEAEWLAEHLEDPDLVIVDCEEWTAYRRAHIPGAVCSSNYSWRLKDPDHPAFVLGPERFAALMEEMGIGDDDLVVAYDATRSLYAARLWWALNYYGHHQVKVLNGGWNKWFMEGRRVSIQRKQRRDAKFTPRPQQEWVVTSDEILASLGKSDFVPLDARTHAEHTGEDLRTNKYGGHMAGAVHLEWVNNTTDDETHVFKPAEELRRLYREAGVTEDKRLIAPY